MCDRDLLIKSECCERQTVQALKLTEANRDLVVEVSGQVPVGFAPRVRSPCQTAENCDYYAASCGQGLPKLCRTVHKL